MKHYRWSTIDPMIYYNKILGNFIHSIGVVSYSNTNMIEYIIYDLLLNIKYKLFIK